MNYPASQQNRRSAVSGPSARASGPGSPCFDSQPFDANTNNNNGNDNALMDVEQDCIESNVITLRDDPEEILEMDGHSIDVLENSRSRENYRTKKHGKRLRPIRSCLVQVV